ncbi:hypothetical protein D3C80_1981980 [compost metagenome]
MEAYDFNADQIYDRGYLCPTDGNYRICLGGRIAVSYFDLYSILHDYTSHIKLDSSDEERTAGYA